MHKRRAKAAVQQHFVVSAAQTLSKDLLHCASLKKKKRKEKYVKSALSRTTQEVFASDFEKVLVVLLW